MKTRFAAVLVAAAALAGLLASPAAAETDEVWDYRAMSLSGTYVPLMGQFGGDGATDILWYAPGTAADSLWIGNEGQRGSAAFTRIPMTINKSYTPLVGDFYGDDYDDIIWYAPGTAADAAWVSDDVPGYFTNRAIKINGTFQPTVLHDYSALNRKDDILWYAPGSAKDYVWHLQESGAGTYATVNISISGTFQVVAGDWNGDGLEDVVLYAPGTAKDYRWASKADGSFAASSVTVNGTFRPLRIHQTDGDSILWWADGTAKEAYWVRSGATFTSAPVPAVPVRASIYNLGLQGAAIVVPDDYDGYFYGEATKGDWYALGADNHDMTTQRAIAGDFDDDAWIDVLFYGKGSTKDEIWYSVPPTGDKAATTQKHGEKATPVAIR
ncbi:hypothetical protein ACE2AJ_07425 [Aquihabitans daechungensis]|uniref:hypothetical protein n=1 Tax=Aquihabitans daechungensis TaxID=1052257 RepID=UPI003B9DCADB